LLSPSPCHLAQGFNSVLIWVSVPAIGMTDNSSHIAVHGACTGANGQCFNICAEETFEGVMYIMIYVENNPVTGK